MMFKNKLFGLGTFLVVACVILWSGNAYSYELKKTIAVSDFENKTNYWGQVNLGSGMADQLTDALIQSGKFVVLERQILEDVMAEQDLAASGIAAASRTAQIGKVVPAQILIKGAVTEFQAQTGGSGTGISYRGISLGSSRSEAHVAVIIRIIDTTSGQVLDSVRVEGKATAGGMSIGVSRSVSFGTQGFSRTPLGKAVQIAIDKAVVQISQKLQNVPFTGKIIKVEGNTIYTNIGTRNGASCGDIFTVYAPGEELIDFDTGENLGSEKTRVGSIKITSVQEKFSKAAAENGAGFERGYILSQ